MFLKELSSSLKSCLKVQAPTVLHFLSDSYIFSLQDCSESISPLYEVFAIARKTGYAEQLDFPKLYKVRRKAAITSCIFANEIGFIRTATDSVLDIEIVLDQWTKRTVFCKLCDLNSCFFSDSRQRVEEISSG